MCCQTYCVGRGRRLDLPDQRGGVLYAEHAGASGDGRCICDGGGQVSDIACSLRKEADCLARRSCQWMPTDGDGVCIAADGCVATCCFKEPCVPMEGGLEPLARGRKRTAA